MTIYQRNILLAAFGAITLTAGDPQLTAFTVEGRMPLTNILPNTAAAAMPPELIEAIESGSLEARLHLEYNASSRNLRVLGIAIPPKTPFPVANIEQLPERAIGMDLDLSIERIYWGETGTGNKPQRTLFAVGRRTASRKSPYPSGEYTIIQIVFDRDAPHKISMLSASMGSFVALTADTVGSVSIQPTPGQ